MVFRICWATCMLRFASQLSTPALKTIDHDFEFCSIESECRVPGKSPTDGLFALIDVNADQEVERSMKNLPAKC